MKIKYKKQVIYCFGYSCSLTYDLLKFLSWRISLLILVLGIFLLPKISIASDITSENIITLTNQERLTAGVGILNANQLLTKAAFEKGEAILRSQTFQHTINDKKFSVWIHEAGYLYSYAGENLAINFNTAEGVIRAWENSYTHKKNLLNPLFKEIGVAVVTGEFDGYETAIVVQEFGAPPQAGTVLASVEKNIFASNDLPGQPAYGNIGSLAHVAQQTKFNEHSYSIFSSKNLSPLPGATNSRTGPYSYAGIKSNITGLNAYSLSLAVAFPLLIILFISIMALMWLYYNYILVLAGLNFKKQ